MGTNPGSKPSEGKKQHAWKRAEGPDGPAVKGPTPSGRAPADPR